MAFKGVLPSELWDKYDRKGGLARLDIDLVIATEINDRIAEASDEAKKGHRSGRSAVARKNQRRDARRQQQEHSNNNAPIFEALRDSGVPITGAKSGEGSE